MENKNFKILAIDDNQDNLTLLKALVKESFPEVFFVVALSGEKGLTLAAQEEPDVILLDIIMPVMDGFEVCTRLKADNILKEIPVVFLTALKGDKQSRIKALECGAEAFLSKPIDESELIAQIRAMVKIRGAYEQKRNEKKRLARLVEEQTAELRAAHLSSLRLLEDLKRENDLRKESERQFQQAIEGAPIPVMLHGEDGEVLSINSTWTELTGYKIEDIPTIENWVKRTAANKITQEKECIETLYELDKRQHDGEFLLKLKAGGNRIWDFYTAFIGNLNDGRQMVMRVGIDITDKKQMEQEVRTSEEKYRLIAENVSDVIWVFNVTKTKMTYVSPSIQQLRGISVEEAMEENIEKKIESKSWFFLKEFIKKQLHIFEENPESADCLITEVQQPCRNGELVWVEMSIKFRYNLDREIEIIGISRNVAERKRAERELITAKEQAEAANVSKSQFLANMSHEIRTPMNGVLGFLQLLEYSPISREQQEYINNIKISTQVLLKVIADILDISKIEAGKMALEKVTLDLELEMKNSVIPFTAKAKEKGLDINLLIRPEVPQIVIGDSLRIKQIIGNLVSNAVKFTEQGEIFIEVSLLTETENEAEINFSIKDTGIGMTEQEVQQIFKPFSQADMSNTKKYGGTGLGLTISKRLIEMMGGHISLISKKERGTILNFCLWFTKSDESNRPKKIDYPVLKRKQILIIDNHKASRDTAKTYLEEVDCLVHEAESTIDALAKLQNLSKHYDVVIIDEKVLQITTETQLENIIEKATQGKIPLILLSSAASDFQTKHNSSDLFSRNISKPYRRSSLINSIAEVLQGKKNKAEDEASYGLKPAATKLEFKNNFKILVVEDNDINIKYFINLLNQAGLGCEVAENGLEALKVMENQEFDIIFMDCQMPVMDGYETTEKIRKTEGSKKHTTIIAMTAYAMAGDKEKCLKAGMDDYLSKPFTHQKLFDMLQKYI